MREAAINTLISSVIVSRIQHGLVAARIYARHQSATSFEDRSLTFANLGGNTGSAKTKSQAFFDQPGKAGALLPGHRPGVGKQGIIDIKRGFHMLTIQISIWPVDPATHAVSRND